MNFFDICIITIILSFMMRIKAKLEIYKDISDLGYRFNHQKYQEFIDKENTQIDIITEILEDYYMIIPFYNILKDAIRETNYYEHREEQFKLLKNYGVLEEMTEEEKKEYNEYKTGYHAIKMEKKRLKKLNNASLAEFSNGSKIWFNFKDDIKETDSFTDIIEIVEVSGEYKNLSIEELKTQVYYSLMIVGDQIIKTVQNNEDELELNNNHVLEEEIIEIPTNKQDEKIKVKTRVRKKN